MNVLAPDTIIHQRYRVVRALGRGGMGAVYEAIDTRLSARVALKQMLLGGTLLERAFEREAKLLANLRHLALPRVLDYFADATGHFIVMEYISGSDLATLLARRDKPFPFAETLRWADTLLDVLAYLHGQIPQVIHRDIKPQNIKLADDGAIFLLDFGLAKGAVALQPGLDSGTMVPGYTRQYAPPEQIQGETTDARSDLYALAATLHHLLTNESPVAAQERMTAAVALRPDPLRAVHDLQPIVPVHIGAALAWAMALNPADRPPSVTALRAALLGRPDSVLPNVPTEVSAPSIRHITPSVATQVCEIACHRAGGALRALAWSPDSTRIAVAGHDRAVRVWHAVNGILHHALVQTGRVLCVDWSPDGQTIAGGGGYGDQALRLWRADDGTRIEAFDQPAQVVDLAFAPDGQTLALALSDGTLRLIRTGDACVLQEIATSGATLWSVAYAPDGQSIAAGCSDGSIRLWRISDGALLHLLHDTGGDVWSVAYAPDGRSVAAGCSDGVVRLWNTVDGVPCFALVGHAGPIYGVAWSPDGQLIATAAQDKAIRLWRATDGAPLHTLIGHTEEARGVAFAPDGQVIASCAADGTVRRWGIPA